MRSYSKRAMKDVSSRRRSTSQSESISKATKNCSDSGRCEGEGAKFYLQLLNELASRGVEDIFIASCLAGISTPAAQAQALNLGHSTVTRWLRQFREKGLSGLFPEPPYPREPYTPERVIVQLIFFKLKCCAPKAGDRELARVVVKASY